MVAPGTSALPGVTAAEDDVLDILMRNEIAVDVEKPKPVLPEPISAGEPGLTCLYSNYATPREVHSRIASAGSETPDLSYTAGTVGTSRTTLGVPETPARNKPRRRHSLFYDTQTAVSPVQRIYKHRGHHLPPSMTHMLHDEDMDDDADFAPHRPPPGSRLFQKEIAAMQERRGKNGGQEPPQQNVALADPFSEGPSFSESETSISPVVNSFGQLAIDSRTGKHISDENDPLTRAENMGSRNLSHNKVLLESALGNAARDSAIRQHGKSRLLLDAPFDDTNDPSQKPQPRFGKFDTMQFDTAQFDAAPMGTAADLSTPSGGSSPSNSPSSSSAQHREYALGLGYPSTFDRMDIDTTSRPSRLASVSGLSSQPTSPLHSEPRSATLGENSSSPMSLRVRRNDIRSMSGADYALGLPQTPKHTARIRSTSAGIGGFSQLDSPAHDLYARSPLARSNQAFIETNRPQKHMRSSTPPYKVLDAPELADDYYLNLVDWSYSNVLAVGLGSCVYLWSATTSQVHKLCDLFTETVTSVSWSGRGPSLAVGTSSGYVHLWDAEYMSRTASFPNHTERVGCLSWNGSLFTSGSHDQTIFHRDTRSPVCAPVAHVRAHKQEVCGLKWDPETNLLASGGNDNWLNIWDIANPVAPMRHFAAHTAAIKALAWSPHQRGLLASGGGTKDMRLRFWNTTTGSLVSDVYTGSQICNLAWSMHTNELVSAHGFSVSGIQNQVTLWRYPSLQPVSHFSGHTSRVLYLALSPDGQKIVTGAGDETLRFWNVFPKQSARGPDRSLSNVSVFVR